MIGPSSWRLCPGRRRLPARTLVVFFLVLSIISMHQSAAASSTTDNSKGTGDWLVECRKQGFDPWQLACQTCSLLPTDHTNNCLACCQSYKDTERIRKPYEAAVLVVHRDPSPEGELQQFLRDDWDDLAVAKGSRLSKTEQTIQMQYLQFSFFHVPSATLLFFDQPRTTTDSTNFETMSEQAREVIRLDGWKRGDMRDMLKALLP